MLGQRHEIARLQSDFYRVQFHKILRWLIVATFIILILVLAIISLIIFERKVPYYANTTDGQVLDMPPPIIAGKVNGVG